ncbi:MerR family transcriptional regulator [Devosia epidermidihirudinis]|uniref:MerR family transcriptional regulator n=1 Tax=Devosia epidermidihirudinis TaxID=1293439 RepID=A0A0F5Q6J8_9HYPH|nr:helix-turn-helix domain-containing protein [Devosia epidermidihirudinis]KKC35654.1 MerR family transcriptional regulator [Devosia epidermidihirudinis]
MKLLDIGEVSQRAGVSPSALRYYEEIGLISSVKRHGLRRQFEPDVLVQLKLIGLGKMAGFSLDEIGTMFGTSGAPELPRDLLRDKAYELDRQILEMAALRDTLRHIADCSAPSHMECPTFRTLLDKAGSDASLRPKHRV